MMNLDQVQRQMLHAVQQPLTPDEQSRTHDLAGRSMDEIATEIIKPNDRLTSFERLEIYNRQYWFRLLSSMAEDFAGLRGIIGERKFEKLVVAYLIDCPSKSFTLRDLGSRLEKWLKSHQEYVPKIEYLAVDMVRLEWAEIEAFDLAEKPRMTPEDIARLGNDPKLQLQPYLQLLGLAYPVNELLLEIRSQAEDVDIVSNAVAEKVKHSRIGRIKLPKPKRVYLAVHRVDFDVYFKEIEPEAFAILSALQRGETLSEAVAAADWGDRPIDEISTQVQQWFSDWASFGWFCKS
jgi:hypothetical protein